MRDMSEDLHKIVRARKRVFDWLKKLPRIEEGANSLFDKEKLAAQELVLEKLSSDEEREALFHFVVSVADYILTRTKIVILPEENHRSTTEN